MEFKKKYILFHIVTVLLYLFFLLKYIRDKTAPINQMVILYVLALTLFVTSCLFLRKTPSTREHLFFTLLFSLTQIGLGFLLTIVWYQSLNDYVLSYPIWLGGLKTLFTQHYTFGLMILFIFIFETWRTSK